MIKSIKTEVQLIHLKGHQDDDKEFEYETAPLSVRMNIDMDASAKLFLKQNQKQLNPNRITPFYTASKIALCIHGNVISKNMEAHIKLHKNGPAVESRLMMKKSSGGGTYELDPMARLGKSHAKAKDHCKNSHIKNHS